MARKRKVGRPKGSKNKKTSKKTGKKRGRKKGSKTTKGLTPLAKALGSHATKVKNLASAIIKEENKLKRLS